MSKIIRYLQDYFASLNKSLLFYATLFIAAAIFINYRFGLNDWIINQPYVVQYCSWYLVFSAAFGFGYVATAALEKTDFFRNRKFVSLLFIAPLIFSWKMVYLPQFQFSGDDLVNEYWNAVVYWPLKVVGVLVMLAVVYRLFNEQDSFYGLKLKSLNVRPYLIMLLIMIPLVALASTQQDFLFVYPKFQKISFLGGDNKGWYKLLYELSYGSDFFTIELFFRGFLVLAFCRYAGKHAVLPMALFYCTIHFGKPMGECISSYFGGLILGIVIYNTKTIFGGLLVHLGIAWLMELGGYFGNLT